MDGGLWLAVSGRTRRWMLGGALVLGAMLPSGVALAQKCTTQANLTPAVRDAMGQAALAFAEDVKTNNAAGAEALSAPILTANFAPTAYLIRTTSDKLGGDTLRVTQLYLLDESARAAGDTSEADFACALSGTAAETDFAIPGLPAGTYGFAMVEAGGGDPWLLATVLRREGEAWKVAGFYPHARTAAGHDGLWYWEQARTAAEKKQVWLAWLLYGEADQLLRPAPFVSSTNLDKLRLEQRGTTPPALSDGIGPSTPLVVTNPAGESFAFTAISAEGSEDGKRLNLMLHFRADPMDDLAMERSRNQAAARAFVTAHPELRGAFGGVWVYAETAGREPFATEQPMSAVAP